MRDHRKEGGDVVSKLTGRGGEEAFEEEIKALVLEFAADCAKSNCFPPDMCRSHAAELADRMYRRGLAEGQRRERDEWASQKFHDRLHVATEDNAALRTRLETAERAWHEARVQLSAVRAQAREYRDALGIATQGYHNNIHVVLFKAQAGPWPACNLTVCKTMREFMEKRP